MKNVTSEEFRDWTAKILNEVGGDFGQDQKRDDEGCVTAVDYFDWDGNLRAQLKNGKFYIDDNWDYRASAGVE